MDDCVGDGYLARIQANQVKIRAAPGAVFLRLVRDHAAEGQSTTMFVEMAPGEVLKVIRVLQAAMSTAIAAEHA